MKIRFLADYQVKSAGGRLFWAGEVVDLPLPSAQHFLRKHRAEVFVPPVDPVPLVPDAPAPEPPEPLEAIEAAHAAQAPAVASGNKPLSAAKRGRQPRQAPAIPGPMVDLADRD